MSDAHIERGGISLAPFLLHHSLHVGLGLGLGVLGLGLWLGLGLGLQFGVIIEVMVKVRVIVRVQFEVVVRVGVSARCWCATQINSAAPSSTTVCEKECLNRRREWKVWGARVPLHSPAYTIAISLGAHAGGERRRWTAQRHRASGRVNKSVRIGNVNERCGGRESPCTVPPL